MHIGYERGESTPGRPQPLQRRSVGQEVAPTIMSRHGFAASAPVTVRSPISDDYAHRLRAPGINSREQRMHTLAHLRANGGEG